MSDIAYTLIRSDRKTTAIRVLTDASIEVRAPKRLPAEEIERFLEEKRNWIETHRQAMLERYPADLDIRKVLYKGNWKIIRPLGENMMLFDGEFFYASPDWKDEQIRENLKDIMKKLAKAEILPMTQQIAEHMNLHPRRITITDARTKWGSCSNGINISFSWRLIAAPTDTIECVIIHELCHMMEMNHSPAFWALMEKYAPDWPRHREVLSRVQAWLDAYYR